MVSRPFLCFILCWVVVWSLLFVHSFLRAARMGGHPLAAVSLAMLFTTTGFGSWLPYILLGGGASLLGGTTLLWIVLGSFVFVYQFPAALHDTEKRSHKVWCVAALLLIIGSIVVVNAPAYLIP